MFPNASIVIDRFHIVQNFTRALNQTRIQIMKKYTTDSHEYRLLKRYWKLMLKNRFDLNSSIFRHHYCFKRMVSQMDIVNHMLEIDEELKASYECLQAMMTAMRMNKYDLLKTRVEEELKKKTVSDKMMVALNTANKYLNLMENTLKTTISNGNLEGSINKRACKKICVKSIK